MRASIFACGASLRDGSDSSPPEERLAISDSTRFLLASPGLFDRLGRPAGLPHQRLQSAPLLKSFRGVEPSLEGILIALGRPETICASMHPTPGFAVHGRSPAGRPGSRLGATARIAVIGPVLCIGSVKDHPHRHDFIAPEVARMADFRSSTSDTHFGCGSGTNSLCGRLHSGSVDSVRSSPGDEGSLAALDRDRSSHHY